MKKYWLGLFFKQNKEMETLLGHSSWLFVYSLLQV